MHECPVVRLLAQPLEDAEEPRVVSLQRFLRNDALANALSVVFGDTSHGVAVPEDALEAVFRERLGDQIRGVGEAARSKHAVPRGMGSREERRVGDGRLPDSVWWPSKTSDCREKASRFGVKRTDGS